MIQESYTVECGYCLCVPYRERERARKIGEVTYKYVHMGMHAGMGLVVIVLA
jgi:hypothetical protein